ncbi:unnamed protein product [Ectocarpus sp. 12 AP-2014]
MNIKLLSGLLFLISVSTIAQDKKWSVEASYPVLGDSNYLFEYQGVLDLCVAYRFQQIGIFQIGLGVNGSLFTNSSTNIFNAQVDNKVYFIQPRLFTELQLSNFRPSFGVGYSIVKEDIFEVSDSGNISDFQDLRGGLNINLGITYDFTQSFYFKAQYDLTDLILSNKIQSGNSITSEKSKEYISQFKFGLGFRF